MLSRFLALILLCTPLTAILKSEQDKWGRVIRDLGIKLQ